MRVIDATPTGRPVLDKVLSRIVEKEGKELSTLVQDRKLNPEAEVVEALVSRGVVDVVPAKLLGLVSAKRPTLDPLPEREVRERLRAVLAGGRPPGEATGGQYGREGGSPRHFAQVRSFAASSAIAHAGQSP